MIIEIMKKQFDCTEIYLSTAPENLRGKHIYEKIGFKSTGKCTEGEELYCLPVERML